MKISICIPQYNRIELLLKGLRVIEKQEYHDIEVVISDDCSQDDTIVQIKKLKDSYKYPIILGTSDVNMGYDRNYRKCIELSNGDYAIVIGNDDTLFNSDAISYLVKFLE